MEYGYIRVSTREQNIARQVSPILQEGVKKERLYIDRVSGKNFERKKYKELLEKMEHNDVLFVKSIDRLGRNYEEIIEQWNLLTKVKNIDIVILDCPLLDTRAKINGLTGKFVSDMVLQILSYVAQIERDNTRQRQMEGIKEAQKRGVRFGRGEPKLPERFEDVAVLRRKGSISLRQGAKMLEVDTRTFARWIKKYKV
jgi:Site-specific recombinases, DNA invertase Pin homologs